MTAPYQYCYTRFAMTVFLLSTVSALSFRHSAKGSAYVPLVRDIWQGPLYASVQAIENSPFPLPEMVSMGYFMLKRGGNIFTVLPLTAHQKND